MSDLCPRPQIAALTLAERAELEENDADNAARILSRFSDRLLYVAGRGWAVWDGARYNFGSGDLAAFEIATELRAMVTQEADWIADNLRVSDQAVSLFLMSPKGRAVFNHPDPQAEARRLIRLKAAYERRDHATRCGNVERITKALEYAKHQSRATVADLDADPMAFVCPNGQIDLVEAKRWRRPESCTDDEEIAARASWLVATDRSRLPTRVAGVAYDPAAGCPNWEAFVALIMPNEEDRACLQRCMGYLLSGENPEAACLILRGPGGNGKSTLLNALHHVLGMRDGYAAGCDIEAFIVTPLKSAGGHNADEVDLPGARAYIATEPAPTDVLSMKKIKGLTGGDIKKTRGAYEKSTFTWVPRGVPILSVNRTPKLKDDDPGTRRRLIFVPLEVNLKDLPPEKRRPAYEVEEEHRAEGSGILNWLVDGWREYKRRGLDLPTAWTDLRDRLLEGADPVGQFLREMTEPDEGGRIIRSDFNKTFALWSEEEGAATWSSKGVNDSMKERGFVAPKYQGYHRWVGLRWHPDAAPLVERATGHRPFTGNTAAPVSDNPAPF